MAGYIEVFIGVLSLVVSLLMPVMFHYNLFKSRMSTPEKWRTALLLVAGCVCVVLVANSSIRDMLAKRKQM